MSSASNAVPSVNAKRRKKQRLFTKDIEQLLYSLGDSSYGLDPTVNALEEVLVEFLTDLCYNTSQYARAHGRNKVKIDDFPFALRNDPLKLARFDYIIKQSQRIEKAKKMFDDKNVFNQVSGGKPEKESNGSSSTGGKKYVKKRKRAEAELEDEDDDDESS